MADPGWAAKVRAMVIAILVTLVFFVWIAFSTDWQDIWPLLRDADMTLIGLAALLSMPVQWLRARRFKLMLKINDKKDWPMFRVAGMLVVFNTLIPFRLGELSFPLLVHHRFGISKAYALGVLTFVRFFDLALVFLLLSLFTLLTFAMAKFQSLALLTGATAIAAMGVMLFFSDSVYSKVRRITGQGVVSDLINRVAEGAASLDRQHHFLFLAYALAIWLLLGAMLTLAAMAVIPSLSLVQGYFAATASNIAFALPINGVASLGPAQVAWAEALRLNDYPYQLAIASALAVHVAVLTGIGLTALVVSIRIKRG